MAKNIKKTNALRLLEQAQIDYTAYEYSVSDGKTDAVSVANKLGVSPDIVYKTLVTVADTHEHFVFVIPAASTLDLKAAARTAGVKWVEMIPQAKLLPLTGYVHGGCSPVGMKKLFPTFIDASAESLPLFFVSAGKVGMNLSVSPTALAGLVNASFAFVSH
ncbi:Cys-tRNA(Pro) deacylase [Phocea massiliensis]|uniref:Cys-tRNA(Pro)/Cys-tRNA(Cys) deacylase n=1 Tax=Merdimmobilis hominis TaxID=2897707 RepID=A0A939BFC8_9FIRM|nr:Cys-tRNA(Pro) deacylase [Merdimmobilis hominis]MBM6921463.1 Cys-tRNA(Pro) deacylase [Merdimmobilis hominis]